MRKNLLGAIASCGLFIGLIVNVLAAYTGDSNTDYALTPLAADEKTITVYSDYEFFSLNYESPSLNTMAKVDFTLPTISSVIVNEKVVGSTSQLCTEIYDKTYVSIATFLKFFDGTAVVTEENGCLTASGNSFQLSITTGQPYFVFNERYLYLTDANTFITKDTGMLMTLDMLTYLMGAQVTMDNLYGNITISQTSGPLESGRTYYNGNSLYWLSHIINAESGNQSLAGKIAVGNVILNRVASPSFPNTIESVIFQRNQFTPASSGSIYMNPNHDSIVAAKLVLDGAVTAGNSLFFNRYDVNAWASRVKQYVTTIGEHDFYV